MATESGFDLAEFQRELDEIAAGVMTNADAQPVQRLEENEYPYEV